MKTVFYFCFLNLLIYSAFGVTYTTEIDSIDRGGNGEPHLILLADGHVAFLSDKSSVLLKSVEASIRNGDVVEVTLDKEHNLKAILLLGPRVEETGANENPAEVELYTPSILDSAGATRTFLSMRRDYQNESQCYNRAHIWTYEAFVKNNIKSNKLFLFFTSRYIRNYRYKWWFHVTPMVYVGGDSQSNWRALDRRYTRGPLSIRTWTNIFMLNNAQCSVVYKWSDYRNHQSERDCYLIPTSMYFWQPRDIVNQERYRSVKSQYYKSEVSHAYWEAF